MTSISQLQGHARFAAAFTLTLAFTACSDGDSVSTGNGVAGNGGAATTGGTPGSAGSANPAGGNAGTGTSGSTSAGTAAIAGNAGTAAVAGSAGTNSQAGTGGGGTSGQAGTAGTSSQAGMGGEGGTGGVPDQGDGGAAGASVEDGDGGAGGAGGAASDPPEEVGSSGTGDDGDLGADSPVDLSTGNSGTRSCADGGDAVNYSVTQLSGSTATLAAAPAAGCLAVGDEVLLINLQGISAHFANVGNYETLRVSAVTGSDVTFAKAKTRFYGDEANDDTNLGTARTNQRVMLQRVPNYHNVTVAAAGSLSASAWDGVKGGVLFFRASGLVSVAGTLSMSGKGYAGGARNTVVNKTGEQGESIHGLGANLAVASQGGGGAGVGDANGCKSFGTSAGGGGYATPGEGGLACGTEGGSVYGEATLIGKLLLGSGGGSGGTDNVLSDNPPGGFGGKGGGIVVIAAANLQVTGALESTGSDGEGDLVAGCNNGASITSCWDYSGPGGAGAGGSILLDAAESSLGAELVVASGGLGGLGIQAGNGGDGGDGRIAVHSTTLTGITLPIATSN